MPALVAVGGSLAALPAGALEIGEVKVNSSLGQPLRASIAYALGPNEAISDSCVSLARGMNSGGLPIVSRAAISIANGLISIRGNAAIREPMLTMRVNVRCPYTPRLSREYMLFVDPARPVPNPAVTPVAATVAPQTVATQAPATTRRRTVSREPISNTNRYRVQPGDALSLIAQRIENRPVGLWDAVAAIFDANPDAFIDNDPNMLKAGSWLSIPDFGATTPLTVADNNVFSSEPAATTSNAGSAYSGVAADEPSEVAPPDTVATIDAASDASDANAGLADLQPGDIILDSNSPFVTTSDDAIVSIPDTQLEGPQTTSSTPNVPTATIQAAPGKSSSNWLLWLAGSGLGIIVALILFGRRSRGRFDASPIGAVAVPQRRRSDGATQEVETLEVEPLSPIEIGLTDESPTEENLALDADLIVGTGLQRGADVDVAQDFGFAATTDLDLELPEEMSSFAESPETDVIPPISAEIESILESEVLPQDEDDYDMSVIVDATQMPRHEDLTVPDLEAVAVVTSDDALITDDYTVSHEVDYKILEQDYEDEMTATQALNIEISKAAAELADRMDSSGDNTSQMTIASVTELDVAAKNDDISDLDDTGINEAITVNLNAEDKTIDMVSEGKTVEMVAADKTVEMPARDDEQTIDMDIKPGKTGTKAG